MIKIKKISVCIGVDDYGKNIIVPFDEFQKVENAILKKEEWQLKTFNYTSRLVSLEDAVIKHFRKQLRR